METLFRKLAIQYVNWYFGVDHGKLKYLERKLLAVFENPTSSRIIKNFTTEHLEVLDYVPHTKRDIRDCSKIERVTDTQSFYLNRLFRPLGGVLEAKVINPKRCGMSTLGGPDAVSRLLEPLVAEKILKN